MQPFPFSPMNPLPLFNPNVMYPLSFQCFCICKDAFDFQHVNFREKYCYYGRFFTIVLEGNKSITHFRESKLCA